MPSPHPFRDELAAAIGRAERLARDNASLRAKGLGRRYDWFQWTLVGLIALCGIAMMGILAAGR